MMQNMQIVEGSSGEGAPREQALQGLEDTLRGQQNLSDEAFRNLQQAPSQSRGEGLGQQSLGETGPCEDATPPSAQDLADRQRRLKPITPTKPSTLSFRFSQSSSLSFFLLIRQKCVFLQPYHGHQHYGPPINRKRRIFGIQNVIKNFLFLSLQHC